MEPTKKFHISSETQMRQAERDVCLLALSMLHSHCASLDFLVSCHLQQYRSSVVNPIISSVSAVVAVVLVVVPRKITVSPELIKECVYIRAPPVKHAEVSQDPVDPSGSGQPDGPQEGGVSIQGNNSGGPGDEELHPVTHLQSDYTPGVAGVVGMDRVHVLDAAEQDDVVRLVPHHRPLPPDHLVPHGEGRVLVVHLTVHEVVALLSDHHAVILRVKGGASLKPRLPGDGRVHFQSKLFLEGCSLAISQHL